VYWKGVRIAKASKLMRLWQLEVRKNTDMKLFPY